jgi:MFS family permease
MQKSKNNLAILIGNALDNYDTQIYILLAPYIARIFFVDDSFDGVLKVHAINLFAIMFRPYGAFVFGKLAATIGPLKALQYSLIGVSVSTLLIGILPGYFYIGNFGPAGIAILRCLQSFFASGEAAIAGLYLVSDNPEKRGFFSSIYGISVLLGMLLASVVCWLISHSIDPYLYWRCAFVLGFATSIVGIYIRSENYEIKNRPFNNANATWRIVRNNKLTILKISIISGFSYLMYPLISTIPNTMLTTLHNISIAQVFKINTYLTILNGVMLILTGYFIQYVNMKRLMIFSATMLLILQVILFWILPDGSLNQINFIRMLIVMVGIPFPVALSIWLANSTDHLGDEKYLITGIGGSFGMDILGKTLTFWSLAFFNLAQNFSLCITFVIIMGLASIYAIYSGFDPKPST